MLLSRLLDRVIRVGTLTVVDANGKTHVFKGKTGPTVVVRLHDRNLHHKLFFNPELHAGEAYMDGTLTMEDGAIYDLLDIFCMNVELAGCPPVLRFKERMDVTFRHLQQFNPVKRARSNVAHHYDLSGRLYDLFLDRDRQYSCAYFANGDEDLETAQEKKKKHIGAKLLLEHDHRVLDIGSGWGGLAMHLAEETGASVTGVTLSEEQLKASRARAARAGLSKRVHFHLQDYRETTGAFERIVSVGMFEHVGVVHYRRYFEKVRDLLTDDGVALLHTIGRFDGPKVTSPWIRKYIFPGGYSPALSEVVPAIEKAGLFITDIEVLRLHYAETLRHWRLRFLANREKVMALYDERFCRMWEYYLGASETAFRYLDHVVFQIQMSKRRDTVPLTRDYLTDWDRSVSPGTSDHHRAA